MSPGDLEYAVMPVNEIVVEEKTADLRWRLGILQQRVEIHTMQSGVTVKSTSEWRDVPVER